MRIVSLTLIVAILVASPASLAARASKGACCPLMKRGATCPLRARTTSCAIACGMRQADAPAVVSFRATLLIARVSFSISQETVDRFPRLESLYSHAHPAPEPPPPKRA